MFLSGCLFFSWALLHSGFGCAWPACEYWFLFTILAVEGSNSDVALATENFQGLSLHNEELVATKLAEDNPAVIIPDHLQVTGSDCVTLSFGSFESGAFSGLLPVPSRSADDNNVELPVIEESVPLDQIDSRLIKFVPAVFISLHILLVTWLECHFFNLAEIKTIMIVPQLIRQEMRTLILS